MGLHNRGHLDKIYDQVDFYGHQVEGVRIMSRMGSFLLADEMGLGKSLQALTVAAVDFERGYASRIIIVCPASLKGNWLDEISAVDPDIGTPKTSFFAMVLDGTPREREEQLDAFEMYGYDVLICNYEQVKGHLARLNTMRFDIGIWDEAHYLKNPNSQRTKASLDLVVGRSFVLTGSPMLNRVDELWALLHRVLPAQFPDYWQFVNRYGVMGGHNGKKVTGVKNRPELMGLLDNVMIRRLKKDVLDLPPKQRVTIKVDMHPEQKALYDEAKDDNQITLPDDWELDPLEIDNPLVKFLRLTEITGSSFKFTGEDKSTKLDRMQDMAEEVCQGDNPEPFVIFTQFRTMITLAKRRLEAMGIKTFEIHGGTKASLRPSVIKEWGKYRSPEGHCAVILVSLKAGGVGLNMTQASKCLFLDRLFVPKLNEQAEDRLHRIGATETVQVFELVCKGTIEARVEQILREKRKLFDGIVEASEWRKAIMDEIGES